MKVTRVGGVGYPGTGCPPGGNLSRGQDKLGHPPKIIGKGPQTFSTVFTRIAGDFGLVAPNPLIETACSL